MSIKKNYLYNLLLQILMMILPLITVPYVSHVLLPQGVGTFAYTSSIISYFSLLGILGIDTYGNKIIAMTRDNKRKMSENFFSLYFLQLMLTLSSVAGYLILVFFFIQQDKNIALIQTISLLGTVIDCSWFFFGIEMFKKIVTRNIVVKLLSLVAIFTFVKHQSDLSIYTYIMCLSIFLSALVMWFYLKGQIMIVRVTWKQIMSHLKPAFIYFLPGIALQIYFVLNKTMIGIVANNSEVGIFDYADKIRMVALSVVTSLGTVMLPRMAHTFAIGQIEKARDYLVKSLDFSTFLAIPLMFGLAGVAEEFIPWYMGTSFLKCIFVLMILSPTIVLMAWSGVFGTQYLVPLGKMREYTTSLYAGAIINFIVNLILIKPFGSIGASWGTFAAELTVTLVQLYLIRDIIPFRSIGPKTVDYFIAGFIMFLIVRIVGRSMGVSILTTVIQILLGSIVYFSILLVEGYLKHDGIIYHEIGKTLQKYRNR
ncbi:flippase [Sporolactobacillus shoreae]|uniref:Flippase n=1 Tax=Sporolactobacillus shoreae TaxID=1465501 RepID=A0A4Z0GRN7_9BACL|nr:polysaccharide biosynthesis C-terminal domain-containing protein [Sporolactobacillus shoreae]TGA99979.1 flippase [Sporolactobacillus shoreae]